MGLKSIGGVRKRGKNEGHAEKTKKRKKNRRKTLENKIFIEIDIGIIYFLRKRENSRHMVYIITAKAARHPKLQALITSKIIQKGIC